MKRTLALVLLVVPLAAAQPLNPLYLWELTEDLEDLSAAPSSTDIVQGFPETITGGIMNDEMLNESFYSGTAGVIDEENEVYSWLMNPYQGYCLAMNIGQPSDGFLPFSDGCPGCPGNPGQFVDGDWNGYQDGILRDYGRAALVMRFGFGTPTDIGMLRVIGGNWDRNGRTFHHYDVYASTQGNGMEGPYFPVALGVKTGTIGMTNPGLWEGGMTEVHDFDSQYLVEGCTDLRIVFYCPDNGQGYFIDPWQGIENETAYFQSVCAGTEEEQDTDGLRKAFTGSIIREIDVFGPDDPEMPWGDIDYDDDRDLHDAAAMQLCLGGSTTANGCFRFDFDDSTALEIGDLEAFAGLMTGPN